MKISVSSTEYEIYQALLASEKFERSVLNMVATVIALSRTTTQLIEILIHSKLSRFPYPSNMHDSDHATKPIKPKPINCPSIYTRHGIYNNSKFHSLKHFKKNSAEGKYKVVPIN